MKTFTASLILALALAVLPGCVATTTDVDRLQDSLNSMQKSQADLAVKMEQLDSSIISFNERVAENNKRMVILNQKLDDVQSRLGMRMEMISQLLSAATSQAAVPVPSDLYRSAYGDYLAGKTDLAITEFKTFIQRYPESDLADDAQFYLADTYLTKKDYAQARIEFDKYLGTYTDLRASALLKRSYAMAGLKKPKDQELSLKTLIKEFPDSSEAMTAEQILDGLGGDSGKSKPKAKSKAQ